MEQLPLFGCARCASLIPGTVSSRLCDTCLRDALGASVRGDELWLEHPDLGVLVSNLGRVMGRRGRVLKGYRSGRGNYLNVEVGGGRRRRVHHLVLETWIGPRPSGLMALHWDDDPDNSVLFNLRWDDGPANAADAMRNGRIGTSTIRPIPTCSVRGCGDVAHAGGRCRHHHREHVTERLDALGLVPLPI